MTIADRVQFRVQSAFGASDTSGYILLFEQAGRRSMGLQMGRIASNHQ
jgi:hypothetical protein